MFCRVEVIGMSSFLHDSLVFLLLVVFIFYGLTLFLLFVGRINLDDSHFNDLAFSAFMMLYGYVGVILFVLLLLLFNQ